MTMQQQHHQEEEQQQQVALLPVGFKFLPTDRELLFHFLKNKLNDPTLFLPAPIHDIQLYDHHPQFILDQLGVPIAAAAAAGGQGNNKNKNVVVAKECYVFTMRSRRFLGGKRPNRILKDNVGYWRASYSHQEIREKGLVGERMNFSFYDLTSTATKSKNKQQKAGIKTDWLMSEYRIKPTDNINNNQDGATTEEDLVLCRIYVNNRPRNNGTGNHQQHEQQPYLQQQHEQQQQQPAVLLGDPLILKNDGTPLPFICMDDMDSIWEEEQQQNGTTYVDNFEDCEWIID